MKSIVECTLPYEHVVRVGVTAASQEQAIEMAAKAFSIGTIWGDTRKMPLLEDDFEEVDCKAAPQFTAEACQKWPQRSHRVREYKADELASEVAEMLIRAYKKGAKSGGSIDWSDLDVAYRAAMQSVKLRRMSIFSSRKLKWRRCT